MSDMSKKSYQLAPDLTIYRIVNGMWQVAGGHGYIDHELAIADMAVLCTYHMLFFWFSFRLNG
jgi:hypothetical protein